MEKRFAPLAKSCSNMQKQINRVTKSCNNFFNALKIRKFESRQYNQFIDKLIAEGRIQKDEVKSFMKNRKEIREILNIK